MGPRIDGIQVVDIEEDREEHAAAADASERPRRRRGRPLGSKAKIASAGSRITASETSFMRAVIQGVDVKLAAQRYLLHLGSMDRRAALAYRELLEQRIHLSLQTLPDAALGARILAQLLAQPAPAPELPSLEAFAESFAEDMFSEKELIALYEEQMRDQAKSDGQAAQQEYQAATPSDILRGRLAAISWVQDHVAQHPQPQDPTELWLDAAICAKLRQHGVLTLSNAIQWINLQGRRWYAQLPGVGRTRAQRLLLWLSDHQGAIGVNIHHRIAQEMIYAEFAPAATVANHLPARSPGTPELFGVVPLEVLAWPLHLLGDDGLFRSHRPNTLKAHTDREAVQAWFATLAEKSAATQDSYRRAVERLILWALVERQTPLASLATEDFIAFKAFLRAPPAHWCQKAPVTKGSPDWRPLRGPLGDLSIQQTMSAIATMYRDWHASGYLDANAVASVRGSKRRDMQMDVMRSFSNEALQAIRATLQDMADGPVKRRLRAAILLLQTAGLRRAEAVNMSWGHIERVRLDNNESDIWALKFSGKGQRERMVPLKPETLQALEAHYQDRLALIASGQLSSYADIPKSDCPLLGILEERLAMGHPGTVGDLASNARREANATGALSAARLHGVLKGFFRQVQEQPGAAQTDFLKASAHWLRHTFAHQSLRASGKDLAVVQQLLGHADISTTGIYVKADMASRVAAVLGVEAAV
ncbi:tyrosine-type recombinase/integrase [Acidovorax bellezanensis]|uniref:tyrosine-type recombinase/integrase n=1 Tax=Acidovorax bellezanensis TaxID=2976702 RepID=UPI0028FC3326|nr:tyrosine-type recombinase/integrase [Acidovorax sp. Be4]